VQHPLISFFVEQGRSYESNPMETRKSIYGKKKVDILISYEPNDSSVKTSDHEARMWQNGKLFGLTQRSIVCPNSTSFWWMRVSMLGAGGAAGVKSAVKKAKY